MSKTSRRDFMKQCTAVSFGFFGFNIFAGCSPAPQSQPPAPFKGYGPLQDDPNKVLRLPKGFSYKIISKQGTKMQDGFILPGKADGMAAFSGKNGRIILVRNHEVKVGRPKHGPFGKQNELLSQIDSQKVYDYGKGNNPSLGGTTNVVYNPATGRVEKEFLSLAGTIRNCAGGKTPWNTWITCEETVQKAEGDIEKDHGFNFEVPATETVGLADPIPLKEMGRFNHEAVAVDPKTSIVYQTEDRHDGLIYRYIPNVREKLSQGGKLQALTIQDWQSADTRNWDSQDIKIGQKYRVEWIDVEDVLSPEDDLRYRYFDKGAARFARGEGMWFGQSEMYFACTNGGKSKFGQVFRYTPSSEEGKPEETNNPGILELFAESHDKKVCQNCDNLTISPSGHVILCEDNPMPFIVGITPNGKFYHLAENIGYKSEFAGVTFSPDGKILFVNIQDAGLTLAITGPWQA